MSSSSVTSSYKVTLTDPLSSVSVFFAFSTSIDGTSLKLFSPPKASVVSSGSGLPLYFSISAGVDHNAVCSYNLTIDFNIDSINYQSAHISKTVYFQEFGGTVNYTKVVD